MIAERARQPALAGLAAAAATLLASLVLLTDSRGTAFAFAASAIVLLALLPGRNRRAWLLLAVLAGLALAWGPLTDVIRSCPHDSTRPRQRRSTGGRVGPGRLRAGRRRLGIRQLGGKRPAEGIGGLRRHPAADLGGRAGEPCRRRHRRGAVAVRHPVRSVSHQYEAFTSLEKVDSGVRFTSGGGNRYDYWRIAWHQFVDHPLDGVGAGNFDRTYFLERRTDEDVRQAHSIELQTLGETGLIGAIALAAFSSRYSSASGAGRGRLAG